MKSIGIIPSSTLEKLAQPFGAGPSVDPIPLETDLESRLVPPLGGRSFLDKFKKDREMNAHDFKCFTQPVAIEGESGYSLDVLRHSLCTITGHPRFLWRVQKVDSDVVEPYRELMAYGDWDHVEQYHSIEFETGISIVLQNVLPTFYYLGPLQMVFDNSETKERLLQGATRMLWTSRWHVYEEKDIPYLGAVLRDGEDYQDWQTALQALLDIGTTESQQAVIAVLQEGFKQIQAFNNRHPKQRLRIREVMNGAMPPSCGFYDRRLRFIDQTAHAYNGSIGDISKVIIDAFSGEQHLYD